MRISPPNPHSCHRRTAARRGERGFMVIALLAIVAIMLIYVNVNMRMLGNLKRELKLVEQQQIQRLQKSGAEPLPLPNTRTNVSAIRPTVLRAEQLPTLAGVQGK